MTYMITQLRMIRSTCQARAGSSLYHFHRSSFNVRDNRSEFTPRNAISREEPGRVPTYARPYVRLKLKTLIEREREEESAWKRKEESKEETVGEQKKKEATKYEKFSKVFALREDYTPRFPLPSFLSDRRKEARRVPLAFLLASRILPSRSQSDRVLSRNLIGDEKKRKK